MKMRLAVLVQVLVLMCCNGSSAVAAPPAPASRSGRSTEKAEMLARHGLTQDAKRELIEVAFTGDERAKAKALYLLGGLEFRENNVTAAIATWQELAKEYPEAAEATAVAERLKQMSEVVQELSKSSDENSVAQTYLSHGDFWSSKASYRFMIDSSWLPKVEMAVGWYDKTIAQFPKSSASRLAHEHKLRALLGWKERDDAAGLEGSYVLYLPHVLSALAAFEAEHPDAATLQAFRFQLAQAYWGHRDWANAKLWLQVIIDKAGPGDSFYKDLAQRRLAKLEY